MRGPQPSRTNRARVLRSHSTSAEDRIWSALRNRRLNGLKFVRQYSIGPYFVDFVCRERMIIVEIDGATHSTEQELLYDANAPTICESRVIEFSVSTMAMCTRTSVAC